MSSASAEILESMGKVRSAEARYDEALALFRRAASIDLAALGRENPSVAQLDLDIGRALERQGRADEAVLSFEHATSIRRAHPEDALALASAQFALAHAFRTFHREPARAEALAREARVALLNAGAPGKKSLAEVEAWLAMASGL